MKKTYLNSFLFIFIIFILIFSGCSTQKSKDEIDQDLRMRINILYEHTIMMQELSGNERMVELGINASNMNRNELLMPEQKIILLEKAYNINSKGNYINRVEVLEDKMNEVMLKWY